MKLVRDDLALIDRGVAWCRYESGVNSYYDSDEGLHRLQEPPRLPAFDQPQLARGDVGAAASYLTRSEARKRFHKHSGDEYQRAEYRVDKDSKERRRRRQPRARQVLGDLAQGDRRVVWVAKGCEDILDEDDPHLDLRDFFPCPKPAYGTVQRGSLVPVPDVLQYKDQLDEINLLTARIHALSDALEAKGFYPAGGAELADAIQAAHRHQDAGARCWCRSRTGRRSAAPRTSSSGCRST
jgi:hypothetical protein